MTSPSIVVTTMHGTFAPDATWVTESSPFCVALKKELNAEVQFETVRWSGANSIDERLRAAELLKAHLHEQLIRHPSGRSFCHRTQSRGQYCVVCTEGQDSAGKNCGRCLPCHAFCNNARAQVATQAQGQSMVICFSCAGRARSTSVIPGARFLGTTAVGLGRDFDDDHRRLLFPRIANQRMDSQ